MKKLLSAIIATTMLSTAAFAGGHSISEFRIGILGGENAQDRMTNNECFRQKTEDLLGVPTKIFAPADYDGVIQGLLGGTIDMAWLGASGYAKTFIANPEAVEPILVAVNMDGGYGYYSVGFARKDSGITSLDDMKGKVFGFGDPNSTSGYLIPSIEIPQATGATMESGDYFGEVKFTGGHEQTIVGVYNKDFDAGVTWSGGQGNWEDGYDYGAFRLAVDSGLIDMSEMVEIWRSKLIPEGPIVMRKGLPEDVKIKMTGLIAGLPSFDKECAYGFFQGAVMGAKVVSHEDYEVIVAARKAKIGG